ncbi:MAG: hypothetical protein ACSHX4_04115 [Opitutaceae bacterium]
MFSRISKLLVALVGLFVCASVLTAQSSLTGNLGTNQGISDKRVGRQVWQMQKNTALMEKNFPLQEWDTHFSSLGSKRTAIKMSETNDKKMFGTKTKEFPMKEFDLSEWNEHYADLQETAQISTDARVQDIADRKFYNMMLQDTRKYAEMADVLSLREINRFQFRRNRSDSDVPVTQVGSEN